jgi:hypothetical protein
VYIKTVIIPNYLKFGQHLYTWVYNDIYNFIYQLEGSVSEKKEFDAEEFIKVLEQFKYDNE